MSSVELGTEVRIVVDVVEGIGLRLTTTAAERWGFGGVVEVEDEDDETDEKIIGVLLRFNRV